MLEYVEEIKQKVEKMYELDEKLQQKKKQVAKRIQQGDITRNEKNLIKDEMLNLVYEKIEMYLQLCKIARRYSVFNLDQLLSGYLTKNVGYDSLDYSYMSLDSIKSDMQKEVIEKFINKNYPLVKPYNYYSRTVEITDLLQKCTGEEWEVISVESPYEYQDIEDYEFYYEKSHFLLAVNKKQVKQFNNVCIDKEKLESLIRKKQCVLLKNIWCYQNGHNNYNYINERLVFNLPLDVKGNSVYEELYPNLKEAFWIALNEQTLNNIKKQISSTKREIKEYKSEIIKLEKDIIESQNKVDEYQKELESQK